MLCIAFAIGWNESTIFPMKIEIEWHISHEARLVIDGRELKVVMRPGVTSLGTGHDTDSTIGGIIASELREKIGDFMQGEAIAYEETAVEPGPSFTWTRLSEALANRVYDRMRSPASNER